jgi:hypothetical protein
MQATIKRGKRVSTAKAFIRSNLHFLNDTKILHIGIVAVSYVEVPNSKLSGWLFSTCSRVLAWARVRFSAWTCQFWDLKIREDMTLVKSLYSTLLPVFLVFKCFYSIPV